VENIKYLGEEKISSIIGVFILNGSNETISKLKQLLKNPVFKEYHICKQRHSHHRPDILYSEFVDFTTKIDDQIVRMLAEADEYDVVKKL
jgi:hypothetical protein